MNIFFLLQMCTFVDSTKYLLFKIESISHMSKGGADQLSRNQTGWILRHVATSLFLPHDHQQDIVFQLTIYQLRWKFLRNLGVPTAKIAFFLRGNKKVPFCAQTDLFCPLMMSFVQNLSTFATFLKLSKPKLDLPGDRKEGGCSLEEGRVG